MSETEAGFLARALPLVNGIATIDTHHIRENADASYLIVDSGRAAFVDTGVPSSLEFLLGTLSSLGLGRDAVEYIFLTHVHLDHSGGASVLIDSLPNAKVVVHPRGASHLVDPSKLLDAAKTVFGEHAFLQQYGSITGIPEDRVIAVQDGQRLPLGQRPLEFIHTPGHAVHHLCILDTVADAIFTGDTFGVSYKEFDVNGRPFIFPSTSPTQFDPAQMHRSISCVSDLDVENIFLTHYGRIRYNRELANELHRDIESYVAIASSFLNSPNRVEDIKRKLYDYTAGRLDVHGAADNSSRRHALLDGDMQLNAAGLDAWMRRAFKAT